MRYIDSILDGIRKKEYEHDFWRYDATLLKEMLAQIHGSYSVDGVKYCFLTYFIGYPARFHRG